MQDENNKENENGTPSQPGGITPPEQHNGKSMGKGMKIAVIVLAVAVVFLLGYLIGDKLSGKGGDTGNTGTKAEVTTGKSTTRDSEEKVTEEPKTEEPKTEEPKTEEPKTEEPKTEEPKTEEPKTEEDQTEEKTETGKDEGKKTVSKPAVYASVTAGSSWESGDGFVVQYSVDVHNMKDQAVKDWQVRIPGYEGAEIGDHWSSELKLDNDILTATPLDYNASIDAKGTTNFGFQVIFTDEAASKKVKMDSAEVYLGGKLSDETVEIPTGADVEKKQAVEPESGTPFESHGALSVKGTDLVDKNGKLFQLKGVSTHGLAWFPDYVNKDAFQTLRDTWGANLIRLAMYTAEGGGYCTDGNKEELKALVDKGVDAATELGMYVIIDWHILSDNNPQLHVDEAKLFFDEMSKKYADYKNVLFEICNEPNGGTTWADVKAYAEEVIPVIRKNAPNAIVIVGSPTWSQDVDKAAADPLKNAGNVVYSLHFYAATHKDNLRAKLKKARDAGLPIFISEFSICDASGNGGIDYDSANEWFQLIEDYGLSYAAWSLSNKAETSALIRSDCEKKSGWSDSDLSETGLWIKNSMK